MQPLGTRAGYPSQTQLQRIVTLRSSHLLQTLCLHLSVGKKRKRGEHQFLQFPIKGAFYNLVLKQNIVFSYHNLDLVLQNLQFAF